MIFNVFTIAAVEGAVRNKRAPHSSASQLWNMLDWQGQALGMTGDPDLMLNYGCYCQLYNGPIEGRGEPVDEFDA